MMCSGECFSWKFAWWYMILWEITHRCPLNTLIISLFVIWTSLLFNVDLGGMSEKTEGENGWKGRAEWMGWGKGWQSMCWTYWEAAKEQEEECGGEAEREEKGRDETGWVVPVMIILAPVGTFGWDGKQDTPSCVPFMSAWSLFPTRSHKHWQSEAGACGSSPVTEAL